MHVKRALLAPAAAFAPAMAFVDRVDKDAQMKMRVPWIDIRPALHLGAPGTDFVVTTLERR